MVLNKDNETEVFVVLVKYKFLKGRVKLNLVDAYTSVILFMDSSPQQAVLWYDKVHEEVKASYVGGDGVWSFNDEVDVHESWSSVERARCPQKFIDDYTSNKFQ